MRASLALKRHICPLRSKHDLSSICVKETWFLANNCPSKIGQIGSRGFHYSGKSSSHLRVPKVNGITAVGQADNRCVPSALNYHIVKHPHRTAATFSSLSCTTRSLTCFSEPTRTFLRKAASGSSHIQSLREQTLHRAYTSSFSTCRNEGSQRSAMLTDGSHRAVVAFGSNLGDRVNHVERALRLMQENGLKIISVSQLYETEPMYYEKQGSFLNGVCLIETELEPLNLLDVLQKIENDLGRVRSIDKGPRTVDLDIILYDTAHLVHDRLKVPHPLMLEREFVLRPLADIIPEEKLPEAFLGADNAFSPLSVSNAFQRIRIQQNPMHSVTVVKSGMPFIKADDGQRQTQIMGILNITPDSFSDGGHLYSENGLTNIKDRIRKFVNAGVRILDIGGQSTRPNATLLSAEEELERIIPALRTIRSMPEAEKVAISVDTFYSTVAEKAVQEGADIINDISAGLLDPQMLSTVARLGKSIVLMHMRGNPQTMNDLCQYPDGVVHGVAEELAERLQEALKAGILPWRIILDPGIGFAKTQQQNLDLLREAHSLRKASSFAGLPWLIGTSRKGFIGKITGVKKAAERQWGTAATVTAAIAGGADIIRVHDVEEMSEVRTMADAIYRVP